ncbi:hypothetical protein P691DRAFT_778304 [Macrolepiota fuliginosa MF-IS2]|uniref:CFEM domain-containing protein n=1 Tax=Macrolepiota fuliginosa MF-IS2 TaxID=1400762 RepID=A0A9P5X6N6_9AGAR|nr:hypothetical protein P691DRAFT_778304 [Macrolepiota fuliginosa MF-IS2]
MNFKLVSLLALVSFVSAQGSTSATDSTAATLTTSSGIATPSGTPQIPPCVQDCITQAGTSAGCDPTDPTCACQNTAFVTAAQDCVGSCTAEEQAAALQLQQQLCANSDGTSGTPASASASGSGSATIRPSSAPATEITSGASRPATSAPGGTTTRPPVSTAAATTAGAGATTSTSPNAAVPIVAQGVWAMAAGILGIAVAL